MLKSHSRKIKTFALITKIRKRKRNRKNVVTVFRVKQNKMERIHHYHRMST